MTNYSKILVDDTTTFKDYINCEINNNISDYNMISSATINLDNERGCNKDIFSIGKDIKIYLDTEEFIIGSHYSFNNVLTDSVDENTLLHQIFATAYYACDGDATDSSVNGNDASIATADLTTDHLSNSNHAYTIPDTSTNYISIPNTILDGATDFTFSAWIKIASFIDLCSVFSGANAGEDDDIYFLYYLGNWGCYLNGSYNVIATDSTIEDSAWHLVTFTRVGTTSTVYLDRASIGSVTTIDTALNIDATGLIIGQNQSSPGSITGSNQQLKGDITGIMFLRYGLTANEVDDYYDKARYRYLTNYYDSWDGEKLNDAAYFTGLSGAKTTSTISIDKDSSTITFWVYMTDIMKNNGAVIMSNGLSSTDQHLIVCKGGDDEVLLYDEPTTTSKEVYWNNRGTLANGWHHYCLILNNASPKLYIDNVDQGDPGSTQKTIYDNFSINYVCPLPNRTDVYGRVCTMFIDDLRIYSNVITDSEKNTIYNSGIGTEDEIRGDTTSPIFRGLINDITYTGKEQNETINIKCVDYTTYLKDNTIAPIVYTNDEISTIVKNIIINEVSGVTTNNVNVTETTLDRIPFAQISVFDGLHQLAELAGYYFYVDTDLDLHFKEKGSVSSGETLNNTNILELNTRISRQQIINKLWVYGSSILTNMIHPFTMDGGSTITLDYNPHNTRVTVSGVEILGGAIYNMSTLHSSGERYLVNYNDKEITFISGTDTSDNVPASGTAGSVFYDRSRPIVKYGETVVSIGSYGPKEKVVIDKTITDPQTATILLDNQLSLYDEPLSQITVSLNTILTLIPGYTIDVVMPNHNINTTYNILKVSYTLNNNTLRTGKILKLVLNKKIDNVLDTLKNIILAQKKADADVANVPGYTRLEIGNNNLFGGISSWIVKTSSIGSRLFLGSPAVANGWIGSPGSFYATSGALVLSTIASGVD